MDENFFIREREQKKIVEQPIKQKSKMFWIIPAILFGIILVSAAVYYVAYHHEITKNIHVVIGDDSEGGDGSGQNPDISYYIIGSGDISDSNITCGSNDVPCTVKSKDISLVNTGNIDRTCTITYDYNGATDITAESSIGSSTIITAGGSVIFYTTYTASETGDYAVKTIIDCPTPSA